MMGMIWAIGPGPIERIKGNRILAEMHGPIKMRPLSYLTSRNGSQIFGKIISLCFRNAAAISSFISTAKKARLGHNSYFSGFSRVPSYLGFKTPKK